MRRITKEMLRYLDNSNDVKVGITALQERLEVPVQFGTSIEQVTQQARSENGQKIFEVFWQEEELCVASWARWEAQRKNKSGNTNAEQKTRNVQKCEGKLRVQDRASERMQDQIIEEIKELVHRSTEEALQRAGGKSMTRGCTKMKKEEAKRLKGRQETEEG